MPSIVTFEGINEALENLNYKNKGSLKYKLINAIREQYSDGDSVASVKMIEYIIIDSPSSFNFLTISGIVAADSLLIPLQCEYFALASLGQYFKIINGLKKKYNSNTGIAGILLNMHNPEENISAKIADNVRENFNNMVFKTIIPRCRSIREFASSGRPILLSDISSDGAKSYFNLAREIMGTTVTQEE